MKVLTEGPPMGRLESSIFSRKGNVTSPVMLTNYCAQCYNYCWCERDGDIHDGDNEDIIHDDDNIHDGDDDV